MSQKRNVIKGQFRPAYLPPSVILSPGIRITTEHRDGGPWLVAYVDGQRVVEVPIEPGTEPDIKRAKVIDINRQG